MYTGNDVGTSGVDTARSAFPKFASTVSGKLGNTPGLLPGFEPEHSDVQSKYTYMYNLDDVI